MSSVDRDLVNASLLLNADPAAAARLASLILERAPGHVAASLLFGMACRKLGNFAEAIPVLEALALARPHSATIRWELARAYADGDRGSDALLALQQAVDIDARFADAWRELAVLYHAAGTTSAGDAAYARYSGLTLDAPELAEAAGALAGNRLQLAEDRLLHRLKAAPGDERAMRMLADIASRRHNLPAAEQRLLACLKIAPGYVEARLDLVRVLQLQQKYADALPQVERLLASQPLDAKYLDLKAQTLRFAGRHDEAIAIARQLTANDPDNEQAWLQYGHLLRELGDHTGSIQMYRRALHTRADSGGAYWSLANLKTFRFAPEDLAAMRARLGHAKTGGPDRIALEFALGKALEDERQFAEAFEHYAAGNRLQRRAIVYDADAVSADVRRSEALYTRQFFAARRHWGSDSPAPIFIVGLPRSGSTLLEQMLGSHSQIETTSELSDIPAITVDLMTAASPELAQYPNAVAALDERQIAAYADRYLSGTAWRRAAGKPRFIDKMLANFGHAGLIHLMFPKAAIIDIRRHPMAACFACYKQYFVRGLEFTYDLVELARYYGDYARLMQHLDSVLPGRVYRIYYEQLVAEPEAELHKVLAYCGLPFEQACLQFHDGGRIVRTISSEQVRKPLYRSSIDQWRNFEPWLGPVRATLGDGAPAVDNKKSPRAGGFQIDIDT